MSDQAVTRRQLVAGGLGAAAAVLTGGALSRAWRLLSREDLVPGEAPEIELGPQRWVVSDEQLSFAVIGDNGSGGRQAMAVAAELARSYRRDPFGQVSMLGDICYYGPISRRFEEVFVRPLGPLIRAGARFEVAVGNHDGDIFGREGVPDVEATLEELGTPARYYAVSRGPADLFYLDSGQLLGRAADAQLSWLDDALGDATKPWRIVCAHHPLYSSGLHGNNRRLVERLEPVLVRHRVDLFLAGHDHHYERTKPIRGITYVVSGGGCKLTPVWPSEITAAATSTLQFLRIGVDGDRLHGRSVGVDGNTLDRFELRVQDGR